jgi:hypothetical protein
MILLVRLKFCWCILNFAGAVFEAKVVPAKDSRQQNSAGARQKIPSLKDNGGRGQQQQGRTTTTVPFLQQSSGKKKA